jgi:anti-sigma-K factor RskA
MSETDHSDTYEGGDPIVAGEYVLGVLDASERSAVAQRIEREPAFASEVAFWEERLGGFADEVKPVAPPDAAWSRIEAAIAAPAPSPARSPALSPALGSLWQNLFFWRIVGIGSSALATACLLALAYLGTVTAPDRTPLLATLGQQGGQPGFVAAIGSGGSLVIVPASLLTANQKSMELWLIPTGAQARPRSLGLIAPSQPVRITVPPNLVPFVTPDASLAVSLEEPGGSRTGSPSNDIIAVGKLTNL